MTYSQQNPQTEISGGGKKAGLCCIPPASLPLSTLPSIFSSDLQSLRK